MPNRAISQLVGQFYPGVKGQSADMLMPVHSPGIILNNPYDHAY